MACGESQGSPAQKDERLISVSLPQRKALNNGQVLLVLNAHEACFSTSFDMDFWEERLKMLGIQMTADQWKNLLHSTVLQPDVRRYLFYNSRRFGITIAVVLYVTLWINLYSTLMIFSVAPSWEVSILVTMIALLVALAIQLIIYQHQRKLNPNTDMRLAAANEVFMKHDFLVGITDRQHKVHSIPQLWFVHFSVGPCLQFLGNTVAQMRRKQANPYGWMSTVLSKILRNTPDTWSPTTKAETEVKAQFPHNFCPSEQLAQPSQMALELWKASNDLPDNWPEPHDSLPPGHKQPRPSVLKRKQEGLCISVEIPILDPGLEKEPSSSLEESPLLPERKDGNRAALTHWETLPLLPEASPEEMARQLLTIFGSYYVRLLVQGQLLDVLVGRHINLGHLPCLCQFIESKMLEKTL